MNIMRSPARTLACVCIAIVICTSVTAGTNVSGLLTSDTTWTKAHSPYIVTAHILVVDGATLTIEPGVQVRFEVGTSIQINGELIAIGTEADMIIFTSNSPSPNPGDWLYLFFTDTSTDASFDVHGDYAGGSVLRYCLVEYAGGGDVDNNGAVRADGAGPFVDHCVIKDNATTGIGIFNTQFVKVTNNTVMNNTFVWNQTYSPAAAGIHIAAPSVVRNNTIRNNSGPMGGARVTESVFVNNLVGNNIGGGLAAGTACTITGNLIIENKGFGMHVHDGWPSPEYASTVCDNILLGNGQPHSTNSGGIYLFSSAASVSRNVIANGLGSAMTVENSDPVITYNAIVGNSDFNVPAIRFGEIFGGQGRIEHNTIAANQATDPSATRTLSINGWPLCRYNNVFANRTDYELCNHNLAGPTSLAATHCWWGTDVQTEIQAKIYDWFDDGTKSLVDYAPYSNTIWADAPISPPQRLTVTTDGNSVALQWAANPEPDVAGYIVCWRVPAPPFTQNVQNVGNTLTHTISDIPPGEYHVAVSAYDLDYNPLADDIQTIINENQVSGHESAPAIAVAYVEDPSSKSLTLLAPNGGEILIAGRDCVIRWLSEGPIDKVVIDGSADAGGEWVYIDTAPNTGTYHWTLPPVTSDRILIRITDERNAAVTDVSDEGFTIYECRGTFLADLNADCYVDWTDFCIFAGDWLKCGNPLDAACLP